MTTRQEVVAIENHRSASTALFADGVLAARLESLAAAEMRRFAQTARDMGLGVNPAWLDISGGVAAYLSPDSPVNRAMGLGFAGHVDHAQIEQIERFFLDRGARPVMGVCPLADPTLLTHLSERGWLAEGFENVLVREVTPGEARSYAPSAGIEVREVLTQDDRERWKLAAASGFSWPLPPLDAQLDLGAIVVRRPGTRLFLAFVNSRVAGTAELFIEDRVAWFSADSTLAQFRGKGVQRALQAHRLVLSAAAGCEIAVSEAAPGSGSQRNMERAGFRVVYSRLDMGLPAQKPAPA